MVRRLAIRLVPKPTTPTTQAVSDAVAGSGDGSDSAGSEGVRQRYFGILDRDLVLCPTLPPIQWGVNGRICNNAVRVL